MNNKHARRKLEETLEGLVIIRTGNGFKIRRKPGPKREQLLKAPQFENSRASLADFIMSSKAGKLLRTSLKQGMMRVTDKGMYNRLTSSLHKVIQSDIIHAAGQRTVAGGQPELLRGFEFNGRASVGTVLRTSYRTHTNRMTGIATVTLDAFSPARILRAPAGATHFILHACASIVNFDNATYDSDAAQTEMIAVNAATANAVMLQMQLTPGGEGPLFLAFGVCFIKIENGIAYPLSNTHNALKLAAVDNEKSREIISPGPGSISHLSRTVAATRPSPTTYAAGFPLPHTRDSPVAGKPGGRYHHYP